VVLTLRFLHVPDAVGFVTGLVSQKDRQTTRVARNGVDKALKERIVSVTKTGKLTDAMRLVAAAKVRRAQDGVLKSRPFSNELTSMIKGLVKKLKGSGLEAELPMLRVPDKVKNVAIILFTGDRGLCGGYNSFAIKRARARIEKLNEDGIVPKMVWVGKKGKGSQKLAGVDFEDTGKYFKMPDTITAASANAIGDEVRSLFLGGEVDKVEVVYSKFYSLLSSEPTPRTILPLSATGIEDPQDETFKLTSEDGKLKVEKEKTKATKAKNIEPDVIFDQPPETILNSMLPLYLNSQILSILFECAASELAARMTAMKAATDNAEDLVKTLTSVFNKKRQAAITQEISEISAGALSLESTDRPEGPALGTFDNEETIEADFMQDLEDGSIRDMPKGPWEFVDLGEGVNVDA
jgi:F-type H+-transporting ATPase subunit gamma